MSKGYSAGIRNIKQLSFSNIIFQKRNFSRTTTAFTTTTQSKVQLPLFSVAFDPEFKDNVAITDHNGNNFKYSVLGGKAVSLAEELKRIVGGETTRVSILCPNDSTFPITLWGSWIAGHAGVPLSEKHPESLLEYYIKSSQSKVIVTVAEYADKLNRVAKSVGSELVVIDFEKLPLANDVGSKEILKPEIYKNRDALILFTSGTTGLPKGVLLTHGNLQAQIFNMCDAWDFSPRDTMLHTLPLHHTHGLIHALSSPLAVGGRVHMLQKFEASKVWSALLSNETARPNILMGVPTVYVKLLEEYDRTIASGPSSEAEIVKDTCLQKMRIMLSGSASLPVPVLEKWERITGHRILERYGMTEVGVALSNPLKGERKPGFVGNPFQSAKVAVADMTSRSDYRILAEGSLNNFNILADKEEKIIGDLLIKGPSVFKSYYNNPEATKKEFTEDGWFLTGDTVEYVDGSFKILGRKSVDIIKSGGYKLSALEIETQLLCLDEVKEVAILGLPDPTWGQKVAAVIAWEGKELSLLELKEIAKARLAHYACPTVLKTLRELPRNHLGKVNKKELAKLFDSNKKT